MSRYDLERETAQAKTLWFVGGGSSALPPGSIQPQVGLLVQSLHPTDMSDIRNGACLLIQTFWKFLLPTLLTF